MDDAACMRRALELAQRGRGGCTPNPMVGCVIVKQGEIIGEGWHERAGAAHAEVQALEQAGAAAAGATLYATLEPCSHHGRTPPCADAIVAAGLARVVAAVRDPHPQAGGGLAALRAAGIDCEEGVLAAEARLLNRGFFQRMESGRPWVRLKTAATLDGRIALPDGSSRWLTGAAARTRVHEMRAESCAVLTSSATALADDPQLTAREVEAVRQPRRVLLDMNLRCVGSDLKLLHDEAVIATSQPRPDGLPEHLTMLQVKQLDDGRADLADVLRALAAELEVNELLVECGARLAGALIKENLVDEIKAFIAPKYLGAGLAASEFGGIEQIDDAPAYRLVSVEQLDEDALLSLERQP